MKNIYDGEELIREATVSKKEIIQAENIYEQFRVRQDRDYISQFDREMAKYLKGEGDKDK